MDDRRRLALGVLVSGRGSNMQSIINAIEGGGLPAAIKVVISDVEGAFALTRAGKHGLKTVFIDPGKYGSRGEFDRQMIAVLEKNGVELVIMAGFMRILSPLFIRAFPNRIMNIHPALLPSFPGLHVQKKAVDYGAKFSGCTVHFADDGVDSGPIIIQAVVPVQDDDNEETLSERILKYEHMIYPMAIRLYAEGRLFIEGRRVKIKGSPTRLEGSAIINPPLE